jgi:hypothetical protein
VGAITEAKAYVNPFEDVHRKAQAIHEKARKVVAEDAKIREKLEQEYAAALKAKTPAIRSRV